jgi:hypothetical protein
MTLKASFVYKNPDSTRDLNARLRRVINRGIVWGGTLTPGVGLTVQVTPLVAVGYDGMTVEDDAVRTLTVVGGGVKQYVVVHARYNEGGVPSLPTLQWRVLTTAAYMADPEKDYMIVVGTVTPAGVVVLLSEIDLTERDEVDPLGRDWYRGIVANAAALPGTSPIQNRVGDFYFVTADHTFYFWNGTIWEPLNTGSYNAETALQNHQVIRQQRDRIVNGSGVIAGGHPGVGTSSVDPAGFARASDQTITLLSSGTASTLAFDTFSALLNGHYVEVHAQELAMSAPPAAPGDRYDIVYLEMWRELVVPPVVPESHQYEGNTTMAGPPPPTFSIDQVDTKMETLQWAKDMIVAGSNVDLVEVNAVNHSWVVLRYKISHQSNLPTSVLYRPDTAAPFVQNVDGVFFSTAASKDARIWSAAAVGSSYDGISWAIPLFVVKRSFGDTLITEFDVNNNRRIFSVHPVVDSDNAARGLLDTVYQQDTYSFGANNRSIEPSGFLTGMDHVIKTYAGVDNVRVTPATGAEFRIRGYEDLLTRNLNVSIEPAPTLANSWSRTLVYLKMRITLHSPRNTGFLSKRHRPLLPYLIGGVGFNSMGWRRGYVSYAVEYARFDNPLNYLDEDDAMTAAGWTRGDLAAPTAGLEYEDGGLWSKSVPLGTDDLVDVYEVQWAIPICLVHRRNTIAWNYATNPNGSAGRPDGLTSASTIYGPDYDVLDLRHNLALTESDLKSLLESDLDKNMKGQLRTRMANKYLGNGTGGECSGTRILQSDSIGPVVGAYQLPAGNGYKRIWSDAKEYHVVSVSFSLTTGLPADPNLFDYVIFGVPGTAGAYGKLTIKAPPGAHLIRHIPGVTFANNDSTALSDYLDFYGPPCWSTRFRTWDLYPLSPATAKYVNTSSYVEGDIPFCPYTLPGTVMGAGALPNAIYQPFAVITKDGLGRALTMDGYVDLSDPGAGSDLLVNRTASLSWWVHYDRDYNSLTYNTNYGLAEIPDEVHKAYLNPSGVPTEVAVGPLCVSVRKACAAASFTITAANVSALLGLSGVTTLVGIDWTSVSFSATTLASVSSVTLDSSETTLTVTLSGAFIGNVDVLVFYRNTVLQNWIEVGRGGKSVQAKFAWQTITRNAAITESYFANTLGSSVWVQPEYAGRRLNCAPFIWHKVNALDPWSLYFGTAPNYSKADYEYSNILSIPNNAPLDASNFFMVFVPVHTPLSSAPTDNLLIHYTYTPYQGISSSGGSAAVIGTALPKLKELLHGTVLEDGDWYASQSGPCSYFSGVHVFSGTPVNRSSVLNENFLFITRVTSIFEGTFPEYNGTWLVKPPVAVTKYNLETSSAFKGAKNHNTPAILRMPYPGNTGMYYAPYTKGPMDFDFDPCRAGCASGFLNLAPGYFSPLQGSVGCTYRTDQFSNGLAQFSSAMADNFCRPHSAADYTLTEGSVGIRQNNKYVQSTNINDDLYIAVTVGGSGEKILRASAEYLGKAAPSTTGILVNAGAQVVLPATSNFVSSASLGKFVVSSSGTPQGRFAYYSYKGVPGVNYEVMVGVHPGEVVQWAYATQDPGARVDLLIDYLNIPDALGLAVYGGHTQIESGGVYRTRNTSGTNMIATTTYTQRVDTIRIPNGYGQGNTSSPGTTRALGLWGADYTSDGRSNLKGVVVGYPSSWTAPMITFADTLWCASVDQKGAGRGVYCGNSANRFATPVLVPGSGTDLPLVLRLLQVHATPNMEAPEAFSYMPGVPLFNDHVRNYYHHDRGGSMAYVFKGTMLRPSSSTYNNRVVLQISGGPNGGAMLNDTTSYAANLFNPDDLLATAIDAFWPTGRPLLKAKK